MGTARQLECGEHPFEVLGGVEQVEGDVVAGPDSAIREGVGEAVRSLVGLAIREPTAVADDGLVIRNRIDDHLPQVGEVELHPAPRWRGVRGP